MSGAEREFPYSHDAVTDDEREEAWEAINTVVKSRSNSDGLHIPRSVAGAALPLCSKHETRESWTVKPRNVFEGRSHRLCNECVSLFDGTVGADLTGRQYEAVTAATETGFYLKKGNAGTEEVAARLELTEHATKKLLNRAHRRLVNTERKRRGDLE